MAPRRIDIKMTDKKFKLTLIINICLIGLFPVSVVFYFIAKNYPDFVGSPFMKIPFYLFKYTIGAVSNILPFSLSEAILIIGIPFLIIFSIIKIIKWVKQDNLKKIALLLTGIFAVSSIMACYFIGVWSVNFHGYDFAKLSGLDNSPVSKTELYETTKILAENLNRLSQNIEYDEKGFSTYNNNKFYKMEKEIRQSYKNLNKIYPVIGKYPQRAKPIILSKPLTYTYIAGIYVPFMAEANVNINFPYFVVVQSVGHEMAHSLGFVREDEAEFIGYLVCKYSENGYYEYSGYMNAYIYASNALAKADKKAFAKVYNSLDEKVRKELSSYNEFMNEYRNQTVSSVTEKVNDTYLKGNGQTDGTKSYGRMVDLLVAEYRYNLHK
ncbi:MAG: DUF3810 domain-containing protein [Clostridia bacterium]|nr:DUF3810 domain-containing protein [Clostridia bacterium]